MNKTYETGLEHDGQAYQVRLYEDMSGGQEPIFIVERGDGRAMGPDEARGIHVDLCARADLDAGQTRLWEQSPEGGMIEHSFTPYQYDANPAQNDMQPGAYENAVAQGQLERQMATAYTHGQTEVTPEQATVETGHRIQSYEQQIATDWRQLSGPSRD